MTNAIEIMMKEYGVEKIPSECQGLYNCPDYKKENDTNCYKEKDYPPFTAEKQIELIKLLSEKANIIIGRRSYDNHEWLIGIDKQSIPIQHLDFVECLADAIIKFKGDLDTAKVKEILEG